MSAEASVLKNFLVSKDDNKSLKAATSAKYIIKGYYHKFVIVNGALFDKEILLAAICRHSLPYGIIAYKYQTDSDGNSHFLANPSPYTMKNLCDHFLEVPLPYYSVMIELKVYLNNTIIEGGSDWSLLDQIKTVLSNRMRGADKLTDLDVSNFQSDPALSEVYFPLWTPPFQKVIVLYAQTCLLLKRIDLSRNRITSLQEFSKLSSCNKLEEIDLRHNEIEWDSLIGIAPQRLKRLWLDGNPLCASPIREYITRVKSFFPNLKQLDGESVEPECGIGPILRNSFVAKTSCQLVDHFLHHYFKWFQSETRNSMLHMYHNKATLSISSNLPPSTSHTDLLRISFFTDLSRNILRISNYAKVSDSFRNDKSQILFTLSTFPKVELDPKSTVVDVPYYVENKVIHICMNGVFRDKADHFYWMGFMFLMQASSGSNSIGEWKITNQLITVMAASPQQIKASFIGELKPLDTCHFELSKEELLSHLKELTSMKTSWCQQFLESTLWDLERALQSFVDQFKSGQVPEEAFLTH